MAIHAAHLGFANRVVVGQIGFGILLLVTPHAVVIHLPERLDCSWNSGSLALELAAGVAVCCGVNGVTVNALDVLRLVCAREPVTDVIGLGMATQAHTVRLLGGTVAEADDLVFRLRGVPAGRHVETARAMALLAAHFLHGVLAKVKTLGEVRMTLSALLLPGHLRTGDVDEIAEVLSNLVRGSSLRLVPGGKRRSKQ